MSIFIVGMGMGNPELLTQEAVSIIKQSTTVIGAERLVRMVDTSEKKVYISTRASDIYDYVKTLVDEVVVILVSGDVGFYSLASLLTKFPKHAVRRICGLSSLVYFASLLQIPWQDVFTVSRHGRQADIISAVMAHPKVFCLTGGSQTVSSICQELCRHGLGAVKVYAGENLSYTTERLMEGQAEELCSCPFGDPSVLLISHTPACIPSFPRYGLDDSLFLRSHVPMTKQEVRAVALAKLGVTMGATVFDIGSGTGACTVELARQALAGHVYAIESDPEAQALTRENIMRFGLTNVTVVEGMAPFAFSSIKAIPDYIFIGGTKGYMRDILDSIYEKNKQCQVVITAITLETVQHVLSYYEERNEYSVDITQIQASRSRLIAKAHMMIGHNPVYIMRAIYKEVSHGDL